MAEEPVSIEQNPGRWLVATLGLVLSEAGVQAILTSQTTPIWITVPITVIGIALILLAGFWKKLRFNRTAFAEKLNRIASHPGLWIAIVATIWFCTVTLSALNEVRLNNEIVLLRNDVQSIAKVIDRGVLPRHLNRRQQSAISAFLSQFEPHEFSFRIIARSEEASSYRADIEQALTKGGWTRSTKNPYVYADDVGEGLSINFIQTMEHSQKSSDPRYPDPPLLLEEAFGLAGVRLSGSSGSAINVTEDSLTISIGLPRKDSYELTPPEGFV
jgi:hypothetical protein